MPHDIEHRLKEEQQARFRSEGERRIAATLDQYGIPFIYEQPVGVRYKGRTQTFRPDFYLPEFNLYIEYYGRVGNQDYDSRTAEKQAAYAANDLNILPVYPWNLVQHWPNYLLDRLRNPLSLTTRIQNSAPYNSSGNPSYLSPRRPSTQPYGRTPR